MVEIDSAQVLYEAHRRGLDQRRLARLLGHTEPAFSAMLKRGTVRASTLERLVRVLATTPVLPDVDAILAVGGSRRAAR